MEEENRHHIFSIPEIREKMIQIFGEPRTEEDFLLIERETNWAWCSMPRYRLPVIKHRLIHESKEKKPRILSYAVKDYHEKFERTRRIGKELKKLKDDNIEKTDEIIFLKNKIKELKLNSKK